MVPCVGAALEWRGGSLDVGSAANDPPSRRAHLPLNEANRQFTLVVLDIILQCATSAIPVLLSNATNDSPLAACYKTIN